MDLIQDSHIAFVNLEHRTDRLEHMNEQLSRVGLNAIRVRGLLPSEYAGDPSKVEVMRKRTPGAIGCHMSQVYIMREALRLGKHAWVMEDDLVFCNDFIERVSYMSNFLQGRDWDVMWLGLYLMVLESIYIALNSAMITAGDLCVRILSIT